MSKVTRCFLLVFRYLFLLLMITIVKSKCWLCSSSTYSKQNLGITGNALYLSNKSHHTVTFFRNWIYCSLLVTFCLLLVTICSLRVTIYSLLVTFCSLLVIFCLVLVTICSLLVTIYSLLITFCPLPVIFCLLLVTFSSKLLWNKINENRKRNGLTITKFCHRHFSCKFLRFWWVFVDDGNVQKVTSKEQKVTSKEQKVTSKEQKMTSNEQKVTSNEQKVTSN